MDARMSIVTLGVADLERSRRFYEQGLGFPVRPESVEGEVVFLDLAGTWLALFGRAALAEDAGVPNEASGFTPVSIGHIVQNREAVDAAMEQAARIGGRVVQPAHETFWGGYSGYFADPDGFLWEVACDTGLPIGSASA